MNFKYSICRSIGSFKFYNKNFCTCIHIISWFKRGNGFIFYKRFLSKNIINIIKFIIFYLKLNYYNYDIFINIKPNKYKKFDNCIDLSLFFSIFLSFFNLNLSSKILIIGGLDFKSGKIIKIENLSLKLKFIKKKIKILIIPKKNYIYNDNKLIILNFEYLYEIYEFLKRCLAQWESNAFTKRLSGVQISQHLSILK